MSQENAIPASIDYYTDVLCVWAWIAQPRFEELQNQWQDKIKIHHRYVDIFGDSHRKILRQWGPDDGFEKFAEHVSSAALPFDASPVHPDIWKETRPTSSVPAHLFLRAVALVAGDNMEQKMALRLRRAFFLDALDISQLSLLMELAADEQLDTNAIDSALQVGQAMADLSRDQRDAAELGIKGSPTWVLNGGRQILYGNIGFRILNANIEEMLKNPAMEASWC